MFKGILLILVIVSCGLMGIFKAQTYSQRIRELDQLRNMLYQLDTEINYRKDPLPVIFRRLSIKKNSLDSLLMSECCSYMESITDFTACWKASVEEICRNSALNEEDISIICELGDQLGKSSSKGQKEVLLLTNEKLRHQLKEATAEKNSKGKMYGGLGFSMGIVIAVLLI